MAEILEVVMPEYIFIGVICLILDIRDIQGSYE